MADANRPNCRELKVLNHFCGEPEALSAFPKGCGEGTVLGMVAKGWLTSFYDREREETVYDLTDAGREVLRDN